MKTWFTRLSLAVTLAVSSACGGALAGGTISFPVFNPPTVPTPVVIAAPSFRAVAVVVADNFHVLRVGAHVQLNDTQPPGFHYGDTNTDGYVAFDNVNTSIVDTFVVVTQPGCVDYTQALKLPAGNQTIRVGFPGDGSATNNEDVWLPPVNCTPPMPPIPSRMEVLKMCMSFQGLTVHTQQYGDLPWWEAPLTWLDLPQDRQAVYAAKHANHNPWCPNGDTHAMVFVPFGKPIYDEPGQPYSADRFPARDWTNGNTVMDPKFVALVTEVRQNGFIPIIVGAEEYGFPDPSKAIVQISLIVQALQRAPAGDLTQHVSLMPGFDGVFYGWEPSHSAIPLWAQAIRAICPWCYIAIEHGTGHIPLGEGASDWTPVGLMKDFDALYSEFNDDQYDDTTWQIPARLLCGAYVRPSIQPSGDDPNPPCYLLGSPRGPQINCAMEFGTYGYVRGSYGPTPQANDDHVNNVQRPYFVKLGYTCGG